MDFGPSPPGAGTASTVEELFESKRLSRLAVVALGAFVGTKLPPTVVGRSLRCDIHQMASHAETSLLTTKAKEHYTGEASRRARQRDRKHVDSSASMFRVVMFPRYLWILVG